MMLRLPSLRPLALAVLVAVASGTSAFCQDDEDEAPSRLVTLDRLTVARLGIVSQVVMAADYRSEISGFGLVVPFDALAQTNADLATAEAAVQTSDAAVARARSLFADSVSVSRQTVEAADRQAVADRAQLSLAQRKAETAWGKSAPWHNSKDLGNYLMRLSSGDLALMRVTFSNGTVGATIPTQFRVERVEAQAKQTSWIAKTIWRAPADPTVPGLSFFAFVERARDLLPGERLLVTVPGERAEQGIIIPANAMILAEGSCWYYAVETQPLIIPLAPLKNFIRTAIDTKQPTADGYFIPGGDATQEVVVEGAGLLLAKETGVEDDED